MEPNEYVVTVSYPGFGKFQGGTYDRIRRFKDKEKARDYYADMLVRYPNYDVEYYEII